MTSPTPPENHNKKKPAPQTPSRSKTNKGVKNTSHPSGVSSTSWLWCLLLIQYAVLLGGGYTLYQQGWFTQPTATNTAISATPVIEIQTLENSWNAQFSALKDQLSRQEKLLAMQNDPRALQQYFAKEKCWPGAN